MRRSSSSHSLRLSNSTGGPLGTVRAGSRPGSEYRADSSHAPWLPSRRAIPGGQARRCVSPLVIGQDREKRDGESALWTGTAGRHRPIRVAARSAMAYTVALVLPETIDGMIELSAIQSPLMPCTRSSQSTTDMSSTPIRQVPTGCK